MAFVLKNSTTILLPQWYKTLAAHHLPHRMMPRDVSTRWNSTFDMLNFALKYRPAIDTMTATRDFDLRKYELVPADWRIAGELRDVLQVFFFHSLNICAHYILCQIFKDATLFFSRGTPNLATVIPAMDHIDKVLATSSDSPHQFSLAIRAALAIGKKAMNRYYNKTDYSDVYRIAMGKILFYSLFLLLTMPLVLHPRHKLEYFKKQQWEVPWIQDACELVRREFDRSYVPALVIQGHRDDVHVAKSLVSHSTLLFDLVVKLFQPNNIFDNLPDLAPMSSDLGNELDRYMATDIEDVKDPLMWWYEHRKAFPLLSLMARDYLSIPGKAINFSSRLKCLQLSSHDSGCRTGFQPRTARPFACPKSPFCSVHARPPLSRSVTILRLVQDLVLLCHVS